MPIAAKHVVTAVTVALAGLSAGSTAAARTVTDALRDDGRFRAFVEALDETGLAGSGAATVFAPTDEAFRRLPEALVERLADPRAAGVLETIVALHLVSSGPHESVDLPVEMTPLASDVRIVVTYTRGALTLRVAPGDDVDAAESTLAARAVTESRVRLADIPAEGALIHGIDMVLLPIDLEDRLDAALAPPDAGVARTPPEEARPPDLADQVAQVADGATGTVVPDVEVGRPQSSDGLARGAVSSDALPGDASGPEAAGADDRFVTRIVPVTRPDDAPSSERVRGEPRGEIVTLRPAPREPGPARVDVAEAEAAEPAGPPGDATPDGEIALARDLIGVAGLLGQPVRDGTGEALGEVVDVLISLDGATAQTLVYAQTGGLMGAIGLGEAETTRVEMRRVAIDPLDGSVILRGDDG